MPGFPGPTSGGERLTTSLTLRIDRVACDGHGLCAELAPELIGLDEWGYPVIPDPVVGERLKPHARRAVAACPVLALRLAAVPPATRRRR